MPYNGEDRRKEERNVSQDMHDMIIRIDANLSNFMSRMDDHVKSDDAHFERLYHKTSNVQKMVWLGLGGLGVITFLIEKVFK